MLHTLARWAAANSVPVTFVAFNLLHLNGEDLTGRPLAGRKRLVGDLHLVGSAWATNGWYPDGDALFEVCVQQGHEGVMAKRLDSPCLPGVGVRTLAQEEIARLEASPCSSSAAQGTGLSHDLDLSRRRPLYPQGGPTRLAQDADHGPEVRARLVDSHPEQVFGHEEDGTRSGSLGG